MSWEKKDNFINEQEVKIAAAQCFNLACAYLNEISLSTSPADWNEYKENAEQKAIELYKVLKRVKNECLLEEKKIQAVSSQDAEQAALDDLGSN